MKNYFVTQTKSAFIEADNEEDAKERFLALDRESGIQAEITAEEDRILSKMKKFRATIDFGSFEMEVEAENEEEANQKAFEQFSEEVNKEEHDMPEFWVGDVEEVE